MIPYSSFKINKIWKIDGYFGKKESTYEEVLSDIDRSNGGFSYKEHTESVSSAMRRDRAACARDHHVCFGRDLLDLVYTEVYDLGLAACMCNEDLIDVYVARVAHAVGDVERKHRGKLAAVLLAHSHLAVLNGNAGLELEQICAESRQCRASAALVQELEAIDDEGRVYVACETSALIGDLLCALSLLCKLCGCENEKSATCREVSCVYNVYVIKVTCCNARVALR